MKLIFALALAAVMQPSSAKSTTADDRAVMTAVLDGALRSERDEAIRRGRGVRSDRGPTGAVFLILDETVTTCSGKRPAAIPGCFDVNASTERRLLGALQCDSESS